MDTDKEKLQRMEALYEACRNSIFRLCLFYLRNVQQAEDAMQETFLKAWKKWESFRGKANEKTWLTAIAANTCRDWLRTPWLRHERKRQTWEDGAFGWTAEAQPEDMDVIRAVAALPLKLREVIVLRFYQRLTIPEISAALCISISGVNRRLTKAKAKLKSTLWEVYFDA